MSPSAVKVAREDAIGIGKALEFTGGEFVAFHDGARGEDALQRGDDLGLAFVHAQRGGLQHEDVLILVHDEAAEEIAFGVDHAERRGLGQVTFANGQSLADATFKESEVDVIPVVREETDVDLGFGIVKADAQKTLTVVLNLHDVTGFR
jgi:hypothetical protein